MRLTIYIPVIVILFFSSALYAEEVNNGTNPTLLATTAGVQYKYTEIDTDHYIGLYEAFYTQPFGAKSNMSLTVTLPFVSGPFDTIYGFGDLGVKFTHVPIVNKEWGVAYTAELLFDTADRPDLGTGQTVAKLSGFYAKFLSDGSIFAPAIVQQIGLGDEDPGRSQVNNTTLDFYYVPKLSNPKFFMTFDPALTYDWESDDSYASLTVTLGMMTGKMFGGNGQVFVKPQILAGPDRPVDWSVQVGYKVIGF